MALITVEGLTMTYRAPVRAGGLGAAVRSLVRREYREIAAVQNLSFKLEPGEFALAAWLAWRSGVRRYVAVGG
jgi:ABC-type uncharacterized transport system ATPase subunit